MDSSTFGIPEGTSGSKLKEGGRRELDKIMVLGDLNVEQLLELHIITEINEHGRAFFSGIISKETSEKLLRKVTCAVTICHECEAGKKLDRTTLFAGHIHEFTIKREGGIYYIKAKCLSASAEFDIEKKYRSFQDTNMTFGQLFQHITGYGRSVFTTKESSEKIPHPFFQYHETDWEFLKRIAGYRKTIVVSDISHLYPQVAIGVIQGKTYKYEQDSCEIIKRIRQSGVQDSSGLINHDISLKIEGELGMNLCDKILYHGIKLIVMKKEINLLNGMLNCFCWIGTEQQKVISMYTNNCICGLRLPGVVEGILGEKVKLRLAIDSIDKQQELYFYSYLPITGNGMFAMPEIGSTVYLYFPDSNEKNAFAVDCLASGGTEGLIPDYRKFETVSEKVFKLLPMDLNISTRNNEASIVDKNGIDLFSNSNVRFYAKGDIIIQNKGLASLHASTFVHMQYINETNDYIHMEGVENTIKTKEFLSSDAGQMVKNGEQCDPKLAWRAAETAKNIVSKVVGAIPSSIAEGIHAKVLGGIPGCESDIADKDISEIAGVRNGEG